MTQGPPPFWSSTRGRWLAAAILFAGTLLLFSRVAGHQFLLYDDGQYVAENARVAAGLSWSNVAWALGTLHFSNWHPLTWLSHMLDVQLFGMSPGAHHLVNALLHALNAALLFLLLSRMTGAAGRSALVAALFAVHPLHVESVAWLAERKDLLSTLLGFLALWAYARYAERPGWWRYAAVLLLFAASLLAKAMWVTLPFLLLLLDLWPLRRLEPSPLADDPEGPRLPRFGAGRLLHEKAPLLALSAASSAVTVVAQDRGGALMGLELPFGARVANALVSYVQYLGKTLWPVDLAIFYPLPAELPAWQVVGSAALLLVVTGIAVWRARRLPWLPVGWFWFLGMLVPVIGLVQVGAQAMADRYTYVPVVGLFLVAAWGGERLAQRWKVERPFQAAAAVLLLVLSVLTWRQLGTWRDHETVFRHAIAVTEGNARAHATLAVGLRSAGRLEEALAQVQEAIRLEPRSARHLVTLGTIYREMRRLPEAEQALRGAVERNPRLPMAWANLGEVEAELGRPDLAVAALEQAVRLDPQLAGSWSNLGVMYDRLGRSAEAREAFEAATRAGPDNWTTWRNLGVYHQRQGAPAQAARAYREALRLKPGDPDLLRRLGLVERAGGAP
jgi:tetratricopeptide (TPR) repeat protein